jgi:mono/diheme cytochrome c family protein
MKLTTAKSILVPALVLVALGAVLMTAAGQPPNADVKRGQYLVQGAGCGDCHTPKQMGPSGPEPDMSRALSGHPQALVMPPAPPLGRSPWGIVASLDLTAWSGPWGVSFATNLTPDQDTGLGSWTARTFVETIRSGRVMGRGRQLLPPMPYQTIRTFDDADLRAMFAYLQTIPAIANRAPDPIAPAAGAAQ